MSTTVRVRGGKRQPRYYYLKEKGAGQIVQYMSEEKKQPKPDCRSEVQKRIDEIITASRATSEQVKDIIGKYK